jgi:hydrogenase expression/formation protein HypE
MFQDKTVTLAHGSGGKASDDLIRKVLLPALGTDSDAPLTDSAVLSSPGDRLAFTTDSFTVTPLFFPGGNIGRLAVFGTVNDLAMSGAKPTHISLAFIIEEGLDISILKSIVQEVGQAAREAEVDIVTGDTKVVGKGAADKLFINTSGIGAVPPNCPVLSPDRVEPGDAILVSGTLGDHGVAVLGAREKLSFVSNIKSDCAPLADLTEQLLSAAPNAKCLRDPTRGGAAAVLNEIARASHAGILIDEGDLPIREEVAGVTELLGLDPLYMANEGKLVAVVPSIEVDAALRALRAHDLGREAVILGCITKEYAGMVVLKTTLGTHRVVEYPTGELLPRIC